MANQVGYVLIRVSDGERLQEWTAPNVGEVPAIPNVVRLPNGDNVHCPAVGMEYSGYMIVEETDA